MYIDCSKSPKEVISDNDLPIHMKYRAKVEFGQKTFNTLVISWTNPWSLI